MAESAKKGGSFIASFLIILFATGVVAIGLFPMRGDIKRMAKKARLYVEENFSALASNQRGERSSNSRAMMLDSQEILDEPAPRKPKRIEDVSKSPQKQSVDKLTPDDRKQLNDLVNSF